MINKTVDKKEKLQNTKYFKNRAIWFLSECINPIIFFIV